MFTTQGLFASTECPERETCRRNPCLFSHKPPAKLKSPPPSIATPFPAGTSRTAPVAVPEASTSAEASSSNPAKRHANEGSTGSSPPRKLLKAVEGDGKATGKTKAVPAAKSKAPVTAGPPVLQASAAASKVPLTDRQQMLGRIYAQFTTLYAQILPRKPTLASEHALAQELEIYNKTNSKTYRNGTINVLLSIKKRIPPTALSHPSVGTEGEVNARAAAAKEYPAVQLTPEDLQTALLTPDQLIKWGYVTATPEEWGPGGEEPSLTGKEAKCERCDKTFTVRPDPDANECQHHWGRIWGKKLEGKRKKIYTCCQLEHPHEGCTRGCHVFYETDPATLHKRHAFSPTEGPLEEGVQPLSIVAIDCEMIYTTAGMSVARVSVVNATGEAVFDELIRLSPGVDVLDYNTRFSGVSSLDTAKMDLTEVRSALRSIIGPDTIVIGHAGENDLKTLRMIHQKIVDTTQLFPHPDGFPRRRALRELASEHLNRTIQAGASSSGESSMGAVGHSSVEDARATLDLVRWWICERKKRLATS